MFVAPGRTFPPLTSFATWMSSDCDSDESLAAATEAAGVAGVASSGCSFGSFGSSDFGRTFGAPGNHTEIHLNQIIDKIDCTEQSAFCLHSILQTNLYTILLTNFQFTN